MTAKLKTILALGAFMVLLFSNLSAEPVTGSATDEKKIEAITKQVSPSVVKVEARNRTKKVATGVVIDKDGYIVTTALIYPRDEKIAVITADGKRVEAEFLGMDAETRLALLQAKEKNLPPISMGNVSELSPGSWIGVVSFSPENTPSITQGIVSSIAGDNLRLNVWIIPGSSGSPVVNSDGKMVGLLRGTYADDKPVVFEFREKEYVGSGYVLSRAEAPSSGMALAIPVDIVKSIASEIRKKGKVERGWMGISIAENEEGRVEIIDVERESPAEVAKLKEGDLILGFEGKDITSPQMFVSEIRKRKPGQDVALKIERDGKTIEVRMKLGEHSEDEARRELELTFPKLFPSAPPLPPEAPEAKPSRPPKAPLWGRFWRWESRKYIGVYLEELNKELSEYFGLKDGLGLLISQFSEDSPARLAGLKIGDVIVKVDGVRVETVSRLSELIQDKKKGDKIKVEFLRDKKMMSLDVAVKQEEKGEFFPSREEWKNYVETWNKVSKDLQTQLRESQARYSKNISDEMKKLHDEFLKKYKEYEQKASEAAKQLKKNLKYYWTYRV